MKALDDIRVFDMTRVLAGPLCTQILGDLGADVIKIERPLVGDVSRLWGPPFEKDEAGQETKESAYYLSCNRNKRSVTLDFTKPAGLAIAHRLIEKSDVFIENFKQGFLTRYGLGYADVKKIKPDIIYCSITGFGQTGPYAHRPGYDFQVQGLSGLMSLIGEPEGTPLRAGISIADIGTGMYSAMAILAALFQRTRTGKGQFIDMALLDSCMALLSFAAQSYLLEGKSPPRVGNGHPNIVPYGTFEAEDGFVIIAIGTDAQFEKFCRFVGREDLLSHPHYLHNDPRVRHREEVIEEMNKIIKEKPQVYWLENLEKIGIPIGPVNTLEEAFQDPQVKSRDIAQSFGDLKTVASPLYLSDSPVTYQRRPPRLGEHTQDVLSEFLSSTQIAELKQANVI
ncbi:MAG: CoA transferase [Alphaproteobacteria bacterium]|nr:CoA transferase [Alphaproteobacteria bacterium]MBP9776913.1 CoA transferase [Alphaproteobacteria bacterium]